MPHKFTVISDDSPEYDHDSLLEGWGGIEVYDFTASHASGYCNIPVDHHKYTLQDAIGEMITEIGVDRLCDRPGVKDWLRTWAKHEIKRDEETILESGDADKERIKEYGISWVLLDTFLTLLSTESIIDGDDVEFLTEFLKSDFVYATFNSDARNGLFHSNAWGTDTTQQGFIFMPKHDKNGAIQTLEQLKGIVQGMSFPAYYGFILLDETGEGIESCWGFTDGQEYFTDEILGLMKEHIEEHFWPLVDAFDSNNIKYR